MGHPSRNKMSEAISKNLWINVPSHLTPTIINSVMNKQPCTACQLAKRNRLKVQQGSGIPPPAVAHTISVDYQGRINPLSVRGYNGYFLFLDVLSQYIIVILTRGKSAETFLNALHMVVLFYQSYGHSPEVIRFDAGSTENAQIVNEGIQAMGMRSDPAAIGSQFQNPVERAVQTINKGVSALLIAQATLPPTYWCYAVEFWVKTSNARPNDRESTPQEEVTGKAPDLSINFQFPFGLTSNIHQNRRKTIQIRYGIRIRYCSRRHRTTIKQGNKNHSSSQRRESLRTLRRSSSQNDNPGAANSIQQKQRMSIAAQQADPTFVSSAPATTDHLERPGTLGMQLTEQTIVQTDPPELRRSARQKGIPAPVREVKAISAVVLAAKIVRTSANPTLAQAKRSDRWDKFKIAIDKEMQTLHDLHTAIVVPESEVPPGKQILHSKWILKPSTTLSVNQSKKRPDWSFWEFGMARLLKGLLLPYCFQQNAATHARTLYLSSVVHPRNRHLRRISHGRINWG
jgi:hypothetical protein